MSQIYESRSRRLMNLIKKVKESNCFICTAQQTESFQIIYVGNSTVRINKEDYDQFDETMKRLRRQIDVSNFCPNKIKLTIHNWKDEGF